MASKHLKKNNSGPQGPKEPAREQAGPAAQPAAPEPQGRHAVTADLPREQYAARPPEKPRGRHAAPEPAPVPEPGPEPEPAPAPEAEEDSPPQPAAKGRKAKKKKAKKDGGGKKDKAAEEQAGPPAESGADEQTVQAVLQVLQGGAAAAEPERPPERPRQPAHAAPEPKKPVNFRRDRAKPTPEEEAEKKPMLSHRDAVGAVISLIAAAVLLAAAVVIWFYRDSFSPDALIYSADTVAVARDEYLFDAGSGEAFAAAGQGLAVANAAGLELLDGSGTPVTSMVMQMESPTAAGCSDFALFYDLGGRRMAVARFDGTVEELSVAGNILSATVSEGGYIAVTTEATGFRALVTVYDPTLEEIYRWWSSSAWVISANVSPDGRKLAVLSYTATGSEVRFFDMTKQDQQGAFPISGTILLDMHWFTSNQLCAISSDQVLFFDADGQWQNTYGFSGQYLIGYTFDGANCAALALSPYRAGTTAKLVSLDSSGNELGTANIQSELVSLTARDLEIMALCSDGAVLYNSSLSEKGRLSGLTGFKYGLLRARGEALLIAANYAEVYTF